MYSSFSSFVSEIFDFDDEMLVISDEFTVRVTEVFDNDSELFEITSYCTCVCCTVEETDEFELLEIFVIKLLMEDDSEVMMFEVTETFCEVNEGETAEIVVFEAEETDKLLALDVEVVDTEFDKVVSCCEEIEPIEIAL